MLQELMEFHPEDLLGVRDLIILKTSNKRILRIWKGQCTRWFPCSAVMHADVTVL